MQQFRRGLRRHSDPDRAVEEQFPADRPIDGAKPTVTPRPRTRTPVLRSLRRSRFPHPHTTRAQQRDPDPETCTRTAGRMGWWVGGFQAMLIGQWRSRRVAFYLAI